MRLQALYYFARMVYAKKNVACKGLKALNLDDRASGAESYRADN